MKKEDLIALGIDEETAKSIMALHGKTVTQLNAQVATAESERDSVKQELEVNRSEFENLKESAKGNEELSQKYAELEAKFNESKTNSEKQIAEQQKDFAIKLALKEADALDESIVLGLLDRDTIKVTDNGLQGLDEQLKGLKESKAFLFQQQEEKPTPTIFAGGNPKANQTETYDLAKMSYQELKELKEKDPETFKKITQ